MPTDTERREVARRLRELPDDSTYPDLIGAIADHDGWYAAADAADRIADLIEPPTRCPHYHSGRHYCSVHEDMALIDRDALLALADEMDHTDCEVGWTDDAMPHFARRIREALGVSDDA